VGPVRHRTRNVLLAGKACVSDQITSPQYLVTCLFGLERVLAEEVRERLCVDPMRRWCEVAFPFDGPPERLHELRVAVNAFIQFDEFSIGHTVPDLERLAARLRRLPFGQWEESLAAMGFEDAAGGDVRVRVKRTGRHNYTYADVEEAAIDALMRGAGRRARLDSGELELRVEIRQEDCRILGRLTPRPLSARRHKVRSMRGETDAALAAAMVRLGDPGARDSFLDPFCGTGTIALERAALGPARRIVAGDLKERCLGWAAANVAAAGAPVSLARWDAARLPFADQTFARIVTSPPHGNPADGRPWQPRDFAPLVTECLRVLEYGGLAVWLLKGDRVLHNVCRGLNAVQTVKRLTCEWKGRRWNIRVLKKALR